MIPGISDVIKEISTAGVKMGLVTSTPRKYLEDKLNPLRRSGIKNLFRVIITTDDVPGAAKGREEEDVDQDPEQVSVRQK